MARMTPEFRRRLSREIRLFVLETRDGCVACRAVRGTCCEHDKLFHDLVLNPRKYLTIKLKHEPNTESPDANDRDVK